MSSIGSRVHQSIELALPTARHRDIADQVGMTPDAFSRALNDKRAFSSVELALLADVLDADLHWLITGEPDPHRVRIAARHEFDHATGERKVPGREQDDQELANVALAYRQAYPGAERPSAPLPASVDALRAALGDDFVREFADRAEERLDVDVVRLAGLTTDYSFTVGGRHVVLLAARANWFRSNWSLAHELAHLALRHHDVEDEHGGQEAAANAFAAELLLPEAVLADIDWRAIGPAELAQFIWDAGVSCEALVRRLDAVRLPTSPAVRRLLDGPTQRLLRQHLGEVGEPAADRGPFAQPIDPITQRMNAAAVRRFPLSLQHAHAKRIARGEITTGTLAWMLDTAEEDLVVDRPAVEHESADGLASALGL
ncbi:ImmA/IrrE family metallo-endopeptidase [Kribbella sp. CA-253562]|uniref:ImmA/IrrE family metallo-endopeptidase n=1 Tax=Kribbella sp. CA-253562 TaxID=3239942 RepID=UPI003D8E7994